MSFFLSGTFWFLEGIIVCVILAGLKFWFDDRDIKMVWWKWLLVVMLILLAGFTIAFAATSLGEREPTAALLGGTVFGVATIVFGAAVRRLLKQER